MSVKKIISRSQIILLISTSNAYNIFGISSDVQSIDTQNESKVEVIGTCNNGLLEDREQCEDGNTENGDGCNDICRFEPGFEPDPICGNNVLETGEACDGTPDCNTDCSLKEEEIIEEVREETCATDLSLCDDQLKEILPPFKNPFDKSPDLDGLENPLDDYNPPYFNDPNLPEAPDIPYKSPNTNNPSYPQDPDYSHNEDTEQRHNSPNQLPIVGPDENIIKERIEKNGHQVTEKRDINTQTLDRHPEEDMSGYQKQPLYRVNNILPENFRHHESFIILPTIKTVAAIDNIYDQETINDFIMGKPSTHRLDMREKVMKYYGTANYGEKGNTVLMGHSSQFYLPKEKEQGTSVGNVFKLLPLLKKGDNFSIIQKTEKSYKVHNYTVQKRAIITPEQTQILNAPEKGHLLTLMTCYPIGEHSHRYIVQATPQQKFLSIEKKTVESLLSSKRKKELQEKANKMIIDAWKKEHNIETEIYNLLQQIKQEDKTIQQDPRKSYQEKIERHFIVYHLIASKVKKAGQFDKTKK